MRKNVFKDLNYQGPGHSIPSKLGRILNAETRKGITITSNYRPNFFNVNNVYENISDDFEFHGPLRETSNS